MKTPVQTSMFFDDGSDPAQTTEQIRLAQLTVCNWGSFHNLHKVNIDPGGTLFTGDNGAGKSTLIDGLMALLRPAGRADFNLAAAQGDKTDRTLLSYMRGSFGSVHDGLKTRVKSKREGAVVSGLRANYQSTDGSQICLVALFWIAQASNSLADVKRLYIVANRDVSLKNEILDKFSNGDIRLLKKRLKADPDVLYCDSNFAEYQEVYRRVLHMDNKNAPALLSRALGLKKIDDLTLLIRQLVLEPSTVKNDARKVVSEFEDLVTIHNQLVDAKNRQFALMKLPSIEQTLQQTERELTDLRAERECLSIYMAENALILWQARVKLIKQALNSITIALELLEAEETLAILAVERSHEAYINAGGNRIEDLKKDLRRAKEKLEETSLAASRYQKITTNLTLATELDLYTFKTNIEQAKTNLDNIDAEKKSAQDEFADASLTLSQQQNEKNQLERDIKAIEARPDSNIDPRYQRLRDEMAKSLDLDPEQCKFIGELIDVSPTQVAWQGAIERALGGLRTTLIVPNENFHLVTRWLNITHTGLHVRVQVVHQSASQSSAQSTFQTNAQSNGHKKPLAEFKADGYLRKLNWRQHPHRDWLKCHLARFDLHCVENTDILNKTDFSMTAQGLIHFEKGRFEKKDQYEVSDRRKWQLGFSNKARLSILKQDELKLVDRIQQATEQVILARKFMDEIVTKAGYWEKLLDFQWAQIDVNKWQKESQTLAKSLYELEHSNDDLALAEKQWNLAKQDALKIQQRKALKSNEHAVKKSEENNAQITVVKYQQIAHEGMNDSSRELLMKRVGRIHDEHLASIDQLASKIRQKINTLYDLINGRRERATNEATGIMGAFRQRWEIIAGDWGASIINLPDYLEHLNTLEAEGLPTLVEQFKERLNRHTTQSIATIKSRIESEREDITERIDIINNVLKRTEFKPGSHLKLGLKTEQFPHVVDFNQKVNVVLSQATSDDHESRFNNLQEVVEILDRASAPATAQNMESLRLLDPRHQLSFHAEELETETLKVLDVLQSSSGKSGGEKEAFAGTIVAASLAYVLTPDGHDRPVYCTVFLDEAFSNTAEAVSRRVLRVFKELNIHVNLITPFKNLNLARESANSLVIAERDQSTHESRLCEVTWEEIDHQQAQKVKQKEKQIARDAETLGIVMNE